MHFRCFIIQIAVIHILLVFIFFIFFNLHVCKSGRIYFWIIFQAGTFSVVFDVNQGVRPSNGKENGWYGAIFRFGGPLIQHFYQHCKCHHKWKLSTPVWLHQHQLQHCCCHPLHCVFHIWCFVHILWYDVFLLGFYYFYYRDICCKLIAALCYKSFNCSYFWGARFAFSWCFAYKVYYVSLKHGVGFL